MSPWIVDPKHGSAIYDLYAVSNHMGGMGGGHYVSSCCLGSRVGV